MPLEGEIDSVKNALLRDLKSDSVSDRDRLRRLIKLMLQLHVQECVSMACECAWDIRDCHKFRSGAVNCQSCSRAVLQDHLGSTERGADTKLIPRGRLYTSEKQYRPIPAMPLAEVRKHFRDSGKICGAERAPHPSRS